MDIATVSAVAGTGATVIGMMVAIARYLVRHLRKVTAELAQWREDWYGQGARPGFPAIPGIPERLQKIEYQLTSNGGGSMKDALGRVELAQHRQAIDHGILVRRMDDHLQQVGPAIAELAEWQRWKNAVPSDVEASRGPSGSPSPGRSRS